MKRLIIVFFLFISFALVSELKAQCSVCRISAESHVNKHEDQRGRGLNKGILYLMSVPYLMGGVGAYFWWKHKKK